MNMPRDPGTIARSNIRSVAKQFLSLLLLLVAAHTQHAFSQPVTVGSGSYSTSLPPNSVGPKNFFGQNAVPKVSSSFSLPIQTNDFWSSLLFSYFNTPYSNVLYAHPLNAKAIASGLQIGYTSDHVYAADDYLYPFAVQLTVGISGLNAPQAVAHDYGDWTVTALWEDGAMSLEATLGHGLPYIFFKVVGGDAVVTTADVPDIWFHQDEVLGVTIQDRHYGIFGPTGTTWSGTGPFQSSLNGKGFMSIALLPDTSAATLEFFREHAYAFVIDSKVDWQYNETIAELSTTYTYETVLMDSNAANVDETLSALYRHQWLYTSDALTQHLYTSPRGIMKLIAGNVFTTILPFSGVLPALPDRGDYNKSELLGFVQSVAGETLPLGATYENGKAIARFSHLVHIADQLGATAERDRLISEIKRKLEDWFKVGGAGEYSYIDAWDVLTGYPSGFGADNQINDHHFHASYAIMSAATVARYDSAWASQDQWGGMVNLLIKDANNWDRTDTQFPFLRSHDAYAGHSWASGHGDFGDGNNQESSSESMNFAAATILWGEATGQQDIRDLGVFLHATEASALEQYWFDADDAVFPQDYPHTAIGIVWGGKGAHATWFGAQPEFIHGINMLPITGGSLHLGKRPEYVAANYAEIVAERNGQPTIWQDVLWEYLAFADPDLALTYYYADNGYTPFDGESRAHTLHWLYNMKKMGRVDTTIVADIPTYAVFRNLTDEITYVAYNSGSQERLVHFSDGFSMSVPPRQLHSFSLSIEDPNAPVALLLANKTSGKAPLTVQFEGSRSFDRNGGGLTFDWTFDSLGTSSRSDTVFTFTETGAYTIRLAVTNGLALTARDSVIIEVLGNGTPYSGTAFVVPGRIEAEHFDNGGEGVAYHDADANNIGLAFRPNEGVDLEPSNDQGFDVYWITAGEWLEYTFEVQEAGMFDVAPYVATVPGFGNLRLLIDNLDVSGKRAVLNTGGWQFWMPVTIQNIHLEAGRHIMRIEADSDTDKTGWLFSLNYIEVTPAVQVGVAEARDLPSEYRLDQNYPNPFNPATKIQYVLPEASHISIEVFNALGQKVVELLDTYQEAGKHTIIVDGGSLASGLYMYKMTTPVFSQTRIMLLIK